MTALIDEAAIQKQKSSCVELFFFIPSYRYYFSELIFAETMARVQIMMSSTDIDC